MRFNAMEEDTRRTQDEQDGPRRTDTSDACRIRPYADIGRRHTTAVLCIFVSSTT